jgi:hypothetical protein
MPNHGNPNPNQDGLKTAPRCSKTSKRTGRQCKAYAIRGTDPPVCRSHAGRKLAAVRAEVAVREEVIRWRLTDMTVDPGELLMRLVTQAAWRADTYADEIARIVAEQGGWDLRKALTGNTYTVTAEGVSVKTGEYIRAMTQLEAAERDRAAAFAAKAVAAGLAERQMRLAERQAQLAIQFVQAVLRDVGVAGTPQATAAIQRNLRLIQGGQAA